MDPVDSATPVKLGGSRALRSAAVALLLVLAVAACGSGGGGDSGDSSPGSSVTTVGEGTPAPADPTATTVAAGRGCLEIANDAIKLRDDFRSTMRGVAGPQPGDEEELRARGEAILAEARAANCPVPAAVEQFLQGG